MHHNTCVLDKNISTFFSYSGLRYHHEPYFFYWSEQQNIGLVRLFVMTVQHVVKISFSVTTQVTVSQHTGSVMVVMGAETGLMNSTAVSHFCFILLLSK